MRWAYALTVAPERDDVARAVIRALDAVFGPEPSELVTEQPGDAPSPLMQEHERHVREWWVRCS